MNASPQPRGGAIRRVLGWALLALCLPAGFECRAEDAAPDAVEPLKLYLPPVPPILDSPGPSTPAAPPSKWPAPPGLAAYVGEPFYAPFSTRLAKSEIGDDLDYRLGAYRAVRSALLTELRSKLDTLQESEPAARQRALADFSREQAPRIAALEREADQLRSDLRARGSGLSEYQKWRRMVAALPASAITPALKLEIIRTDVFYREGLSPGQRRLLSAIAMQLADKLNPPTAAPGEKPGPILYFSPETARFRLSPDLPGDLVAKITAYREESTALENTLLLTIYPQERNASEATLIAAMRTLAETQAPRLAALESMADEIRLGLAGLNDPSRLPDLPALPADLVASITAYRAEKLALNKALLARRDEVMKTAASTGNDDLALQLRQAIAAFTRENADRYAALDRSRDQIHDALGKLTRTGGGSADSLLAKFAESLQQLQTAWDYREYRIAVLQPGLAPEQRRLLFEAALERLAPPLPGGEIPPAPP